MVGQEGGIHDMLVTGKTSLVKLRPTLLVPRDPGSAYRDVWFRCINSPWLWLGEDANVDKTNSFSITKSNGVVGPVRLDPTDELWGYCTKSSTFEWLISAPKNS